MAADFDILPSQCAYLPLSSLNASHACGSCIAYVMHEGNSEFTAAQGCHMDWGPIAIAVSFHLHLLPLNEPALNVATSERPRTSETSIAFPFIATRRPLPCPTLHSTAWSDRQHLHHLSPHPPSWRVGRACWCRCPQSPQSPLIIDTFLTSSISFGHTCPTPVLSHAPTPAGCGGRE